MISASLAVRAALLAIAAMIAGILVTMVWIGVYAGVIDPGHGMDYYEANASLDRIDLFVAPVLLLAAGWLAGRRAPDAADGAKAGLVLAIAYIAIDLAVMLGSGGSPDVAQLAPAYALKAGAAVLGGWLGGRSPAPRSVEPVEDAAEPEA